MISPLKIAKFRPRRDSRTLAKEFWRPRTLALVYETNDIQAKYRTLFKTMNERFPWLESVKDSNKPLYLQLCSTAGTYLFLDNSRVKTFG